MNFGLSTTKKRLEAIRSLTFETAKSGLDFQGRTGARAASCRGTEPVFVGRVEVEPMNGF